MSEEKGEWTEGYAYAGSPDNIDLDIFVTWEAELLKRHPNGVKIKYFEPESDWDSSEVELTVYYDYWVTNEEKAKKLAEEKEARKQTVQRREREIHKSIAEMEKRLLRIKQEQEQE